MIWSECQLLCFGQLTLYIGEPETAQKRADAWLPVLHSAIEVVEAEPRAYHYTIDDFSCIHMYIHIHMYTYTSYIGT